MRVLSLTQPWATLIMLREKWFETRSWKTSYTGLIAIHAAKGFPRWARETAYSEEPFSDVLSRHQVIPSQRYGMCPDNLTLGAILGVCDLLDCVPVEHVEGTEKFPPRFPRAKHELEFGDYADGRWAWRLANVRAFKEPIPAKGALGLWNWDPPESWERMLV